MVRPKPVPPNLRVVEVDVNRNLLLISGAVPGAEGGRVMCITIHPAVIGQAQRAKYVDLALQYLRSFPDVWFASGRDITEHYMAHCYDAVVERIRTWPWTAR